MKELVIRLYPIAVLIIAVTGCCLPVLAAGPATTPAELSKATRKDAESYLMSALAELPQVQDPHLRDGALAYISGVQSVAGDYVAAELTAQEIASPYQHDMALSGIAMAMRTSGQDAAADALLAKIQDVTAKRVASDIHLTVRMIYEYTQSPEKLLGKVQQQIAPEDRARGFAYLAMRKQQDGKPDEARILVRRAQDELPAVVDEMQKAIVGTMLVSVQTNLGDDDAAAQTITTLDTLSRGGAVIASAKGLATRGRFEDAEKMLAENGGNRRMLANSFVMFAEDCASRGDEARARAYLEKARAIHAAEGNLFDRGTVLLQTRLGQGELARRTVAEHAAVRERASTYHVIAATELALLRADEVAKWVKELANPEERLAGYTAIATHLFNDERKAAKGK